MARSSRIMPTTFVTGSNRGIGLELAKQGKSRGEVIAACRSSSPELDRLGVRVEAGVDVGSDASARALRERMKDQSIDVLILNAGIMRREALGAMDFSALREQFEVNALGPLRIVDALLPNLREGSKIAIITSRMGSIGDNTSGGAYGYRMSKAAVNAAGVSLAHDLKPRGVAVAILHPGYVRTDMTGGTGHVDAAESARNLWARIDGLTLKNSGTFWHMNGETLPW
jgi:NAD(P)-dependent dehydrogenase (short-subunit alcohol dehydrogenase family)